jgi:hypothetical protein
MATKGTVEIFLDLSKYVDILSDTAAGLIASDVRKFAREGVAVDTGRLRNSVRLEKIFGGFEVISETPYSLAQEYGRPDLPQYTFTPYMRPAAEKATSEANILKRIKNAESAAIRGSKK